MNYLIIAILTVTLSFLSAGCGGCQIKNDIDVTKKSSAFITSLPYNKKVEGFVMASCNKCNLSKSKDKKCSMGIKIGDKVYSLKNDKHDHNAAHNSDGICNAMRIAYVEGVVKSNEIDAKYFQLIESPK